MVYEIWQFAPLLILNDRSVFSGNHTYYIMGIQNKKMLQDFILAAFLAA
jgi:hypothetical protein